MKRDMDLIRKLVLAVESHPHGFAPEEISIEGYSPEQIAYHSYLLIQAGLAEGSEGSTLESSGPEGMISNLTWAGHEFAEASRDDGRWRKATGLIRDKGGAMTISVVTGVLTQLAKQALGL